MVAETGWRVDGGTDVCRTDRGGAGELEGPGRRSHADATVAMNPSCKQARKAELGDKIEAERLGWTQVGKSE